MKRLSLILVLCLLLTGCSKPMVEQPAPTPPAVTDPEPDTSTEAPVEPSTPSPSPTPVYDPGELEEWDGIVEHLFFHPVIAYPELAFDGDYQEKGLDDWMVQ